MTRTEAIAAINHTLASLDDQQITALADIARDLAEPAAYNNLVYRLSDEERRLVREGIDELNRGEYASDAAVEALLRHSWE
jgi:hypothetical protein